jgi:hypothetical protein
MDRASFVHIVEVVGGLSEEKQKCLRDDLAFLAGTISGINKGLAAAADGEPDRPEVIAHAGRVTKWAQKLVSAAEHPPIGYDPGEAAMRHLRPIISVRAEHQLAPQPMGMDLFAMAARAIRSVAEETEEQAQKSKKKAGRKRSFARDAALSEAVRIYAELGFVPATTKGGLTARFCEAVFDGFGLSIDGIDSALPAAVAEWRRMAREEAEAQAPEIARAEANVENADEN